MRGDKRVYNAFEATFYALKSGVTNKVLAKLVGGFLLALFLAWLVVLLLYREPDFGPLPDFSAINDVAEMKMAFFEYLSPVVQHHNDRVLKERSHLMELKEKLEEGGKLNIRQQRRLKALAKQYGVDWYEDDQLKVGRELVLRIDIVPVHLAIAQAAKESGWGRSRFAKEGNNLFGQWCYKPGCGMVPKNRSAGKLHEVMRFDSVSAAVLSYINNLNTHPKYHQLRKIRSEMRGQGVKLDALQLAECLTYYSQRRDAYIVEVRAMIRQFEKFKAGHADT